MTINGRPDHLVGGPWIRDSNLILRVPRSSSAWAGIFFHATYPHGGEYSCPLATADRPLRFEFYRTCFSSRVMTEAAPLPVLRTFDESALHGISMDVAKLLHELLLAPDIEVVVAGLPERICRSASVRATDR